MNLCVISKAFTVLKVGVDSDFKFEGIARSFSFAVLLHRFLHVRLGVGIDWRFR